MPTADRNCTGRKLASLFNVTERRVQQLAVEGIVKKEARGKYHQDDSVRGYIRFLQAVNAGTQGEIETVYGDARTQKMRADADRSIMETAQLAGQLIPKEIVAYSWNHMIGAIRAKLLNLPKKTAAAVQHETGFRKCNKILTDAVHACLAELSAYQPPAEHFGNLDNFLDGTSARLVDKPVGRRKKKAVKRKQRRAG